MLRTSRRPRATTSAAPDVEVEHAPQVAPGDEDREECDDGEDQEREPEEREHDVVRDREQPLHEPQPAAHIRVELAFDMDWVWLLGVHGPPRWDETTWSLAATRADARLVLGRLDRVQPEA